MKNTIYKYLLMAKAAAYSFVRIAKTAAHNSQLTTHNIVFVMLACTLIPACTKQIEIKPEFQLDGSSPLANIKEADNVLTGAYDGFQNNDYYRANGPSGAYSVVPDIMGDDLIETFESLGNYRAKAEWTYVPNDPDMNATWLNAYSIISGVNIILRDIDAIAPQDPKAANRIKGQALAIRAHVHFDLLRAFGEALDRNSAAKGIPYVIKFDVTAKPARNTVKESYDKILADLAEAATILSGELDKPINNGSRNRIDWLVVKAMQARINLYAGEWQAAADAATAVIDQRPLSTIDEFPFIWNDESTQEVVWAVSFDNLQDGVVYDNVFFARGNRSAYRPAQGLTALYDQVNDVRYNTYMATVDTLNDIIRTPRLVVIKHLGKDNSTDGVVDWKVFRTGEMYLIRAEANFKLTKEADALDDLNMLRENRIDGFTPGTETGAALWTAITTERRKELAFEGHRFFDFKRWNKTPINRCASNTNTPSAICSLASSSRSWAWPIPFNETIVNPNIKQNDDY